MSEAILQQVNLFPEESQSAFPPNHIQHPGTPSHKLLSMYFSEGLLFLPYHTSPKSDQNHPHVPPPPPQQTLCLQHPLSSRYTSEMFITSYHCFSTSLSDILLTMIAILRRLAIGWNGGDMESLLQFVAFFSSELWVSRTLLLRNDRIVRILRVLFTRDFGELPWKIGPSVGRQSPMTRAQGLIADQVMMLARFSVKNFG